MNTFKEDILPTQKVNIKIVTSFLIFISFFILIFVGWHWLQNQPQQNKILSPLRNKLDNNEAVFSNIFSSFHLAKTYPISAAAKSVRVNGDAGVSDSFNVNNWKLQVIKNPGDTFYVTIDEIKKMPKTDIVFDFKCIEGWSQITHWAGVKFSDFVKKYNLQNQCQLNYAGIHTPDNEYYVGIDTKSMLHPQTILCYEMNGMPLPLNQGAPLRLIIPVKYGVKHIKRIGSLFFSNARPPDYWFERGYDYYCGL